MILKKIILLILITSASSIYAQVTIDLTNEGRSMHHFRTQDQNSVGTCYANTASAMLEAILPGGNEISYFDLSLKYIEAKGRINNITSVLDYGYVCKTIEAAKESGGVCSRTDVLFENYTIHGDPQDASRNILKKIDSLYESLSRKSDDENNFFFNLMEDYYNKKLKKSREKCQRNMSGRHEDLAIYQKLPMVADKLHRKIDSLKKKKNKTKEEKQILKKLKKANSKLKNKIDISIPISFTRDAHKIVNNSFIKKLVKDIYVPAVNNFNIRSKTEFKILENKIVTKLGLEDFPEIYQDIINFPDIYKDRSALDVNICTKVEAVSVIGDYDLIFSENREIIEKCELHFQTNMLREFADLIKTTLPFMVEGDQSIFDIIKTYKDKKSLLRALFKSTCHENKIEIPENLTCDVYDAHKLHHKEDKPPEEIIPEMRNKIISGLSKNVPLGLGVCGIFLDDNNHKSNFGDEDSCDGAGGMHQYHALIVVGYREKKADNGDITREYLLQNSWGDNCGYKPLEKNCIGNTGRFWIEESILLNNTREIYEVNIN